MQNSSRSSTRSSPRLLDTRVLRNLHFFRVALETSRSRKRKRKREGEGERYYLCWINTSRIRIALLKQKKKRKHKRPRKTPPFPFALLLSLIDSAARFINSLWHWDIKEEYISRSRRKQTVWRLICRDTKASFSQQNRRRSFYYCRQLIPDFCQI